MSEKQSQVSEHPYDDQVDNVPLFVGVIGLILITIFSWSSLSANANRAGNAAMLGSLIIFIIIMAIRRAYYGRRNPKITVYQNGIEYTAKGVSMFWRWDAFHISMPRIIFKKYTQTRGIPYDLKHHDGQKIRLDKRYSDYQTLLESVITKLLTQRDYLNQFTARQTIQIGSVSVNQLGVQIADKTLMNWEDISHIIGRFNQIEFVLSSGKTISYSMSNIPDAPILYAFLVTITGQAKHKDINSDNVEKPQLAQYLQSRLKRSFSFKRLIGWTALLVIAIYVYGTGIYNLSNYDPITLDIYVVGAVGLIAPIIAIWNVVKYIGELLSQESITISKRGLHYHNRQRDQFWEWETISGGVMLKDHPKHSAIQIVYDVMVDEEQVVRIRPQFERFEDVVNTVQRLHANAHYVHVKTLLESGEVLNFAPVAVDQFGIQYGGNSYKWGEIYHYRQHRNHMGEFQYVFDDENGKELFSVALYGVHSPTLLHWLLDEKINGVVPQITI